MKLRSKRRALFISAIALVLVLMFQNMSFVEFVAHNITPIDEDARRLQAQELLGEYYRNSLANDMEHHPYLNFFLLNEVERALGPTFKSYASPLTDTIIKESKEFGLDPIFVIAVIKTESTFNPNARGTSGEIGLMQVLPKTAEWIANKHDLKWYGEGSLYDPVFNVKIGIRYFALLRSKFRRTAFFYIPAYNMGPTNLRRVNREIASVQTEDLPEGGSQPKLEFAYSKKVMLHYRSTYKRLAAEQRLFEKQYVGN